MLTNFGIGKGLQLVIKKCGGLLALICSLVRFTYQQTNETFLHLSPFGLNETVQCYNVYLVILKPHLQVFI